jgi:DNA-binding response OmpR family regulator
VNVAEAGRGSRPGELHRRRVVLVAESAGLAVVLGHLLGPTDRLSRLGSLRELPDSQALENADVVVLDLPDGDRAAAVGQVRRRYRGPLVVLAGEGEDPDSLPLDDARTVLHRPFSVDQLRAALAVGAANRRKVAVAATVAAAAGRVAGARPTPLGQAARGRPDRRERAQRLLVALVEGWRARRQIRVAGFSILALIAFGVAFAVAQGCDPACGALDTGVSSAPTITVAGGPSRNPSVTGPKHAPRPTRTAPVVPGAAGAYQGISSAGPATATTTGRLATTTTRGRGSGGGAPTTRPPTTPITDPTTEPPTTPTTEPPTTPTTEPPTTPTTEASATPS